MLVGILKEIKSEENRVALTGGVEVMVKNNPRILLERVEMADKGWEVDYVNG